MPISLTNSDAMAQTHHADDVQLQWVYDVTADTTQCITSYTGSRTTHVYMYKTDNVSNSCGSLICTS